jgi:hypothetical protein
MRHTYDLCSMSSNMLILLAARRVPALRDTVLVHIAALADSLSKMIEPWLAIHTSEPSPSVQQSLWLIREVGAIARDGS